MPDLMNVSDLKQGEQRTVSHFTDPRLEGKLLCLGVKPGCAVELVRRTTFSSTLYIKVADSRLAIRRREAACIELR